MPELTYLQIRGTLAENMVYQPRRGYETTRPGRRSEGDPAYEIVLLDGEGRVLVSVTPDVLPSGCGSLDQPLQYRVRAVLPLHPDGVAYELRRGDQVLHSATLRPRLAPVGSPTSHRSADGLKVSWEPVPRSDVTYSTVVQMESGSRVVLTRDLTEPTVTVQLTRLPHPGRGALFVVASDGMRSSQTQVAAVDVPVRPPTVHIIRPAADERIPFGEPVSLLGCCLDMTGQPCPPDPVAWILDGELTAAGSVIAVIANPRPGTHRLTLAYGSGADAVESVVVFEVEEPDDDYRQWNELMAALPRSEAP